RIGQLGIGRRSVGRAGQRCQRHGATGERSAQVNAFHRKPLKASARHRRGVSDGSARESLYQRGGARGEGCSSRSAEGANSCSAGVSRPMHAHATNSSNIQNAENKVKKFSPTSSRAALPSKSISTTSSAWCASDKFAAVKSWLCTWI